MVLFESYRDLVRLMGKGLTEEQGLREAHDENLAVRAQRRGAASAAFRVQSHQSQPGDVSLAAGTGMYSAVGFSYGNSAPGGGEQPDPSSSSSSSSDDSDDDGGGRHPGSVNDEQVGDTFAQSSAASGAAR